MKWMLLLLLAVILVFICVLIIRTLLFKPVEMEPAKGDTIALQETKIIQDMVDMIRCKTVSDRDETCVDWGEFEKFQQLLLERFPKYCVMRSCKCTRSRPAML